MPSLVWINDGSDATQSLDAWNNTAGAVASDTGQAHTGPRSIKCDSGGTGSTASVTRNTGLWTGATGRLSIWFRFGTIPTFEVPIIQLMDGGSTNAIFIRLKTSGVLRIRTEGGTNVDGATVLSTGTWYQLTVAWRFTSYTDTQIDLYLGPALEATLTNGTFDSFVSAPRGFSAGWLGFMGVNNALVHHDDHVADDGSPTDGYPGAICVTAKLPATDNGGAFDTAIGASPGAGSRYTNINERPLSVTNGWQQAGSTQVDESYAIQAASVGDVDLAGKTIIGRMSWVYWKFGAGAQGTAQIWDNGSRFNLTGVTTNTYAYHCSTSSSYPSDAAAVGIRSGGNAADTFVYECGMLVAYLPSTAWSQSLNETISLTDTRSLTVGKSLTEALSLTDGRALAAAKALAESLALSDARSLAAALRLAETLALTDAGVRSAAIALAEALALSDARSLVASLSLSETLPLTEERALALSLALVELLSLSESRALTLSLALAETLELLDARSLSAAKAFLESLPLADQADVLLITALIICYGGLVEIYKAFGGTLAPTTRYGGTVAPAIAYGGTVEGCGNE